MPSLPAHNSPRVQQLRWHGTGENTALNAYSDILQAQAQALAANNQENVVLVRIVGFLILELHARRQDLGNWPFSRVVEEVTVPPRYGGSKSVQIFGIGRQYSDHLIRACTFNYPCVFHSKSQFT